MSYIITSIIVGVIAFVAGILVGKANAKTVAQVVTTADVVASATNEVVAAVKKV